jgi:hypothetical protein
MDVRRLRRGCWKACRIFLGDGPGVRLAADVGQQGDELVAAVAGQGVAACAGTACSRSATARSRVSPSPRPWVSFTCRKRSMSMSMTAMMALAPLGLGDGQVQAVVEEVAVGKLGERVVEADVGRRGTCRRRAGAGRAGCGRRRRCRRSGPGRGSRRAVVDPHGVEHDAHRPVAHRCLRGRRGCG